MARLSRQVGAEGFARYFEHQTRVRLDGTRVDVIVPTGFVAELIGRKFGQSIIAAVREEIGVPDPIQLTFSVDRAAFAGRGEPQPVRAEAPPARPPLGAPAPRYRLDDFIIGESNRLAFTAAQRMAEPDCPASFSPLFIHGACGMGKTHLLQGIAHRFRERNPGATAVYIPAEAFTNEYVSAVRAGRLEQFRRTYRAAGLLLIDDVQFLSNKHATQGELLHTFEAIGMDGARVVLASDEHPRRVRALSAALVSRFMAGMVVRLDPPEPALRERIVNVMAERRGLKLEPAAAALIAARCGPTGQTLGGSVRDIEGVVTRVDAMRRLLPDHGQSERIGLVAVRKALGIDEGGGPVINRSRRPIRADQIIDEVCRTLRVEQVELLGRGRHKRVVLARTLSAHLCRQLTTLSFPEIARALGRPNHSTVVTACKRIAGQIAADRGLDLGPEGGADLAGLGVRGLVDQVRDDILRAAPPG
jgi:chromosomal replication initiator protein